MSDLTTWLRFIPTDLRVVVPVHFPTTFTRHERMPTVNALDAGIVAHEAADRIDKLEECLRDFLAEHDNAAIEQPDAKTLILYWARNNDMVTKARALLEDKP